MSRNYEHAVHGKRRVSLVNDSNANHQQDSRLALELQKIEREKERLSRRSSLTIQNKVHKRRTSLAESRMMRTLSKHDLYLPMEKGTGRRSSVDSVSTDSYSSLGSDNMNRTMPYSELIDKDRFEKFCVDTKKLSMSAVDVHNLKEQMNIGEHDLTGFMGDMNIYLRKNNTILRTREQAKKEFTEQVEDVEEIEGNIEWDSFIHPRTLEQIKA
ncbi:uncharacterized protein LOC134813115 [Bolinopsis microptera]|uniref:uncharacterized protein LOC134813115 n=1 Tax=Bolinopsis microptera TaxID=2820187 RepID=UPI003079DD58